MNKRLVQAAAGDAVGYILGLIAPGAFFPLGTMASLIRGLLPPWLREDYFLRDDLRWKDFYTYLENEVLLTIPLRDQNWALPYSIVASPHWKQIPKDFRIEKSSTRFHLTPRLSALTATALNRQLFRIRLKKRPSNEPHVRIVRSTANKKTITFYVEPVEYFDFLRTNMSLDYTPEGHSSSIRAQVHSDGRLPRFEDSQTADIIGINILLFTADGSLVIPRRSRKVAIRANQLGPSASGAIKWLDVDGILKSDGAPMIREGFEELGILPNDVPSDDLELLGVVREIIRGGEPEIFYLAHSTLSQADLLRRISNALDRYETSRLTFLVFGPYAKRSPANDGQRHEFRTIIDRYLEQNLSRASLPLLAGLALFSRARLGEG